jgi:hypothetical protein
MHVQGEKLIAVNSPDASTLLVPETIVGTAETIAGMNETDVMIAGMIDGTRDGTRDGTTGGARDDLMTAVTTGTGNGTGTETETGIGVESGTRETHRESRVMLGIVSETVAKPQGHAVWIGARHAPDRGLLRSPMATGRRSGTRRRRKRCRLVRRWVRETGSSSHRDLLGRPR